MGWLVELKEAQSDSWCWCGCMDMGKPTPHEDGHERIVGIPQHDFDRLIAIAELEGCKCGVITLTLNEEVVGEKKRHRKSCPYHEDWKP